MNEANHFQVLVSYGKDEPNIFRSEEVSFCDARTMIEIAQDPKGMILLDTRYKIAEVCQEPAEAFDAVNDWEYVPRVLPDWMRLDGMDNVLAKCEQQLHRLHNAEIRREDLGGTLCMVIDAIVTALEKTAEESTEDAFSFHLQLEELRAVLISIGADEHIALVVCAGVLEDIVPKLFSVVDTQQRQE